MTPASATLTPVPRTLEWSAFALAAASVPVFPMRLFGEEVVALADPACRLPLAALRGLALAGKQRAQQGDIPQARNLVDLLAVLAAVVAADQQGQFHLWQGVQQLRSPQLCAAAWRRN